MSRTTDSSRSGSGSEAPPPPPLSDLATKLETKLKKQDTANKDVFARKLKEEEVRHFHPMADIIAERLLSPKLLSEVRPIFHDFMLLRLSLRRMDKMLAAVERQTRRISKAVTRRRKIAASYVKVAPSSPSASSAPSASSLASGPQPVALSARQTRFLALKKEQVSQLETRLSAFIGSHTADTLSRPFKQYLHWQMGELANARKKIEGYGKDRGTQSTGSLSKTPLGATPTSQTPSKSVHSQIASTSTGNSAKVVHTSPQNTSPSGSPRTSLNRSPVNSVNNRPAFSKASANGQPQSNISPPNSHVTIRRNPPTGTGNNHGGIHNQHGGTNSQHGSIHSQHGSIHSQHGSIHSQHGSIHSQHGGTNITPGGTNITPGGTNSTPAGLYITPGGTNIKPRSTNSAHTSANIKPLSNNSQRGGSRKSDSSKKGQGHINLNPNPANFPPPG